MKTIYSYTRKQAIEDEVLIDISETAKEAGIGFPVAITSSVNEQYVKPDQHAMGCGEDEKGRLWDLCHMLSIACRRASGMELKYKVIFSINPATEWLDNERPVLCEPKRLREVKLKSLCGPGDDAGPVITVMMPDED